MSHCVSPKLQTNFLDDRRSDQCQNLSWERQRPKVLAEPDCRSEVKDIVRTDHPASSKEPPFDLQPGQHDPAQHVGCPIAKCASNLRSSSVAASSHSSSFHLPCGSWCVASGRTALLHGASSSFAIRPWGPRRNPAHAAGAQGLVGWGRDQVSLVHPAKRRQAAPPQWPMWPRSRMNQGTKRGSATPGTWNAVGCLGNPKVLPMHMKMPASGYRWQESPGCLRAPSSGLAEPQSKAWPTRSPRSMPWLVPYLSLVQDPWTHKNCSSWHSAAMFQRTKMLSYMYTHDMICTVIQIYNIIQRLLCHAMPVFQPLSTKSCL